MKTINRSYSKSNFDIAKRAMFLIQTLIVGLFIPFAFVFGISYKGHHTIAEKSINVTKQNPAVLDNVTVDFGKILSDKNS